MKCCKCFVLYKGFLGVLIFMTLATSEILAQSAEESSQENKNSISLSIGHAFVDQGLIGTRNLPKELPTFLFFDFNPETTRGLLDFMAEVSLSKHFNLKSSTFLFGRDRGVLPEDEQDGIQLRRGDRRYTQYFKLSYIKKFNKAKILVHAGYSYSWTDLYGPTFYADRPGFNNIGISTTRNIFETNTVDIPSKLP